MCTDMYPDAVLTTCKLAWDWRSTVTQNCKKITVQMTGHIMTRHNVTTFLEQTYNTKPVFRRL